MPDDSTENRGPFDFDKLRELVELMEEHGLTEVSLRRGDERWRLRRGPQEVYSADSATAFPAAQAPAGAKPATAAEMMREAVRPLEDGLLIKSPTVGTFYASPSPDDPPFVSVGSRVEPDTTVCIVEAMKVFNQIPAEVTGTVIEILVKNGDPVEFGQPLFRVKP